MVVTGGLTVKTAGLTVANGVTISSSGLIVTGGLTVNDVGLSITGGGLKVIGGAIITGGLTVYGNLYVSATITTNPSDRRLKRDIMPIDDALAKVNRLNGVYFKWIQNEPNGLQFDEKRHVGVIAQEVQGVLPEVVQSIHNDKYLGVDYASLVPLIIEAVRELDDMFQQEKAVDAAAQLRAVDLMANLTACVELLKAQAGQLAEDENTTMLELARMEQQDTQLDARMLAIEKLLGDMENGNLLELLKA
jgi:hypothetical protein